MNRRRGVDSRVHSSCHSHTVPCSRVPRWWATLALLALCIALSSCAVGNFGILAANVQRRDNVSVLSVFSVGLHVRTRGDDPGAHFGYSRRSYAFAADDTLMPGWYFLSVPSPARPAFAQDLMTIGVEVSSAAPEAGFTLGYARTRLLARLPLEASVFIGYVGSDQLIDKFQIYSEDTVCAVP